MRTSALYWISVALSRGSCGVMLMVVNIVWFAAKEQEQERRSSPDSQIRNKANEVAQLQREEMRKELLGK